MKAQQRQDPLSSEHAHRVATCERLEQQHPGYSFDIQEITRDLKGQKVLAVVMVVSDQKIPSTENALAIAVGKCMGCTRTTNRELYQVMEKIMKQPSLPRRP